MCLQGMRNTKTFVSHALSATATGAAFVAAFANCFLHSASSSSWRSCWRRVAANRQTPCSLGALTQSAPASLSRLIWHPYVLTLSFLLQLYCIPTSPALPTVLLSHSHSLFHSVTNSPLHSQSTHSLSGTPHPTVLPLSLPPQLNSATLLHFPPSPTRTLLAGN